LKELPESFLSALPGARHTALVALLKRALDLYSGVPERDARADLTAFNLGFIWGEILMFQEVTSCPALTYDKQSYAIYGKKQSTVRRGRKADAPPAVVEYVKRLAREAKHRNSNLSPWDIALEICNKHRDSLRKPDKQNEHFSEQTVYKWVREELNKKSNSTI